MWHHEHAGVVLCVVLGRAALPLPDGAVDWDDVQLVDRCSPVLVLPLRALAGVLTPHAQPPHTPHTLTCIVCGACRYFAFFGGDLSWYVNAAELYAFWLQHILMVLVPLYYLAVGRFNTRHSSFTFFLTVYTFTVVYHRYARVFVCAIVRVRCVRPCVRWLTAALGGGVVQPGADSRRLLHHDGLRQHAVPVPRRRGPCRHLVARSHGHLYALPTAHAHTTAHAPPHTRPHDRTHAGPDIA